jgi:arsenate reductase (thioredoxin)
MCQIKDISKQDVLIGEASGPDDCCAPSSDASECCAPLACEPLPEAGAQELALLFKAVADPMRLRLLSLIACHDGGESCVCDLTAVFDVTPPSISYHLKILREAGLISSDRRGTWVFYRVNPDVMARMSAVLTPQPTALAVTDVPEVLFMCTHNAGRSQMAAALLASQAAGRVRVTSAGSEPADAINPAVTAAMTEIGIDISRQVPSPLESGQVEAAGIVITMGCGDACPVFPGKRYLAWDLPDPAGLTVEQVRPIRDDIAARVRGLLAELTVSRSMG